MEYFETKFKIEGDESLISTAADLLTDMAAECGFEAFTGENNELTGYAQVDLYDQEALNNLIEEFPLEGVTITYTTEEGSQRKLEQAMGRQRLRPYRDWQQVCHL